MQSCGDVLSRCHTEHVFQPRESMTAERLRRFWDTQTFQKIVKVGFASGVGVLRGTRRTEQCVENGERAHAQDERWLPEPSLLSPAEIEKGAYAHTTHN
jgi:hypothetical protein